MECSCQQIFLILFTEDPSVDGVDNDERDIKDESKSMLNGQTFEPGKEYQDPPVDGVDNHESLNENVQQSKAQDEDSILQEEGMVNGQNFDPERVYQDPPVDGVGDKESLFIENMQQNKAQDSYEDSILEDKGMMVNGRDFQPGQRYQDPSVDGADDQKGNLEDERKSNVNEQNSEPEQKYQEPPVDGVGNKERKLEDEAKMSLVNGQNSEPGQRYHSTEIKTLKGASDVEMDPPGADGKTAF